MGKQLLLGLIAFVLAVAAVPGNRADAALGEPAQSAALGQTKPGEAYRFRIGDTVAVTVSPQQGYSADVDVEDDGYIRHPKLGDKVLAVGLTGDELRVKLFDELNKTLKNPRVVVRPLRKAPIPEVKPPPPGKYTIVGAISRTGEADIEPDLRLRKAIDRAGGFDKDADKAKIIITHRDLTQTIVDLATEEAVRDLKQNVVVRDGDSIEIVRLPPPPEVDKPMVHVGGYVTSPGAFPYRPRMTLEEAIVAAGKMIQLANPEQIQIERGDKTIVVNLEDQVRKGFRNKVRLEPEDEIYIPQYENRVLLIGGIQNPGPRPLKPGQRILELLDATGDLSVFNTSGLNPSATELIRNGRKEPLKINLIDARKKKRDDLNVVLENGDIIYIPPKGTARKGPLDYLGAASSLGFLFSIF